MLLSCGKLYPASLYSPEGRLCITHFPCKFTYFMIFIEMLIVGTLSCYSG